MIWLGTRATDTGPSWKTRATVWDREQGCCAACGRVLGHGAWYSIQHRIARGTGGDNSLENLILLCGSATSRGCHRTCENRDDIMHERGFWLRSWEDPAQVPVLLYTASGRRERWLTKDGGYSASPPAEQAS